MRPSEERKVVRDGLVRFSDRISELIAEGFELGNDDTALRELLTDVWSVRRAIGLLGGEVSVDESASTSQEAEAAE